MINSIKKVAVLGASGTVGSLTGGLIAQNGIDVFFLSRTYKGTQMGLKKAIEQARSEVIANNITCGDYDTSLEKALSQADWIVECIAENIDAKREMYRKIDAYKMPGAIVSSVTSSLPLEMLVEGLSDEFKRTFLSTHFYNPPGRMLACEVTGHPEADPEVIAFMSDFLEKKLRRVVTHVCCKAAFVGNRIAFVLFNKISKLAGKYGVEKMEYLVGPYTGRLMPAMATIDLVGLDIHKAIIENLQQYTDDYLHDELVIPDYVNEMVNKGYLGRKSREKCGFYKKLQSGKLMYIDPLTVDFVPAIAPHVAFVERAKDLIHIGEYYEAFETIKNAREPEAEIVMEILLTYVAYSYALLGEVIDMEHGMTGIDRVMSFGFNWAGPSLIAKMLGGREEVCTLLEDRGMCVPDSLRNYCDTEEKHFNFGRFFVAK